MEIDKEEINIIDLIKNIWKNKISILKTTFLFVLLGVTISLLLPHKFSSSTIFIPQANETSANSSISGVASLVGLNIGSNSVSEIQPSMYPKISSSPKFKRLMLRSIIDEEKNITLSDFIKDYYQIHEKSNIQNSSIYITEFEEKAFKYINQIISVNVNQKEGYITITSTMPEGKLAAMSSNIAREILQKIIIDNKIESAKQSLLFSENQLKEKLIEFENIQDELAYFKDSNLNLVNTSKINKLDKIEAESQIINAVVTELSKQVEQAKLQVNKNTPVFSTIEEATIPVKRSSPHRTRIVIIFFISGLTLSSLYFSLKENIVKLYIELKK